MATGELSLSRLAIVAISIALLWRIIQVNVVMYEDTGRPRLVPRAHLESPQGDRAEQAALQEVLRRNPGEVAALLMLARRLEAEGVHHAGNGTQQLTAIDLGILLREPNALECD